MRSPSVAASERTAPPRYHRHDRLPAVLLLGMALVISVGLQQPAASVGLRWAPRPLRRALQMIELEPLALSDTIAKRPQDPSWLRWVPLGIAGLAMLGLVWFALRWLLTRRRPRPAPNGLPAGAHSDVALEPNAQVLKTGLAAAIALLADARDPGNAVIGAWQALEDAAARAGLSRRPSETTSEFTARILYRSRRSEASIAALLTLYQRVRFGEHQPTPHDIATATQALTVLVALWRSDLPERRLPKGAR